MSALQPLPKSIPEQIHEEEALAGARSGDDFRGHTRRYCLSWLMFGLMVIAAVLSVALKPNDRMVNRLAPLVLAEMIPTGFGTWRVDTGVAPMLISADVQAALAALYTETLERTYINDRGERIMLSIAYGRDQGGDGTQVHRPEFCYSAQGFGLSGIQSGFLDTSRGSLPIRRLVASQGPRHEPVSYWVTVGEHATLPGLQRKLIQLRYGLDGKIPDGMLVRVSSIDRDAARAYVLQDAFIRDMVDALAPGHRRRVAGATA